MSNQVSYYQGWTEEIYSNLKWYGCMSSYQVLPHWTVLYNWASEKAESEISKQHSNLSTWLSDDWCQINNVINLLQIILGYFVLPWRKNHALLNEQVNTNTVYILAVMYVTFFAMAVSCGAIQLILGLQYLLIFTILLFMPHVVFGISLTFSKFHGYQSQIPSDYHAEFVWYCIPVKLPLSSNLMWMWTCGRFYLVAHTCIGGKANSYETVLHWLDDYLSESLFLATKTSYTNTHPWCLFADMARRQVFLSWVELARMQ